MFEEFIQSPAGRAIAAVVISALAILIIDLKPHLYTDAIFLTFFATPVFESLSALVVIRNGTLYGAPRGF